jgi:phenylacetate-CoA ligase
MSLEDVLYPLLSLYDRLPPFVREVVGAGYRRLPRSWTLGAEYAEFEALAREGECWTEEAVWSYQRDQLRRTLVHAGKYCPYYHRAFSDAGFRPEALETPTDLSACPVLQKQALLDSRDALLSTQFGARARLYITTGGSTGVPVGFYLQKGISRPKERAFLEASWQRGGFRAGARLAVIRGHVTSSTRGGRIADYDGTRDWLMLSSYHLTVARLPEYLEALERFRPDLLHAYPSAALQLADCLAKTGRPWRLPLQGLLCGSERLPLPQKRLLEQVFRCPVYRWYGHSERVVLAGEGRESELFYFWPQYGFVEFGPPDAEGLQEVIGTSFHNLVMPLIRYRTGDYVRVVPGGQRTEFPWPAVSEIAGREQEFLVSAGGRQISLTAVNMHSDVFDGLYAVQFYQDEPGVAELRYVAGPRFDASRLSAIESTILRKLGDDFRLILRAVDETEKTSRGKHRWLVSRLAGPSARESGLDRAAPVR